MAEQRGKWGTDNHTASRVLRHADIQIKITAARYADHRSAWSSELALLEPANVAALNANAG